MGKFPFKRLRVISKNFPTIDSHIDGVTKSLEGLVFSYSKEVDKTLQKKRLMMAVSSLVLLLVLGSFISPKGRADSTVFHPDTCLGGWINPKNAEGEPETTSNGDASQFNKNNSAILPKNTDADIYCGNFTGKFDETTKPTKMLVSLSLTKGEEMLLETSITGESFASSTQAILDAASTTEVSFTLLDASSSASSTPSLPEVAGISTSTEQGTSSSSDAIATSSKEVTESTSTQNIATTSIPLPVAEEASSFVGQVMDSVKDTLLNLFEKTTTATTPPSQTDTVVVPPQVPVEVQQVAPTPTSQEEAPAVEPSAPTSFFGKMLYNLAHNVAASVFAQTTTNETGEDLIETIVVSSDNSEPKSPTSTEEPVETTSLISTTTLSSDVPEEGLVQGVSSSTSATTVLDVASTTASLTTEATTTLATTTSATTTESTPPDDNQFQNNFLEVFYTFDGSTWESLGVLNEISMKYRTFEIPVTASTSWKDMSQLQIKIASKKQMDETPTVYLDGIKVEVLYETTQLHQHPDFTRDTILKDEVLGGVRIVTIINNDTNQEEVWYMYLEEVATSTLSTASSTLNTSTSTLVASGTESFLAEDTRASTSTEPALATTTTSEIVSDALTSSSTVLSLSTTTEATSTQVIKPIIPKNKWLKFEGKVLGASTQMLLEEIKKADDEKKEVEEVRKLPDFSLDIIKRIKGTFLDAIVLQLEKEGKEELWIYDIEKNTEEKIEMGTSTSLSLDSPLGIKGGYIFWLTEDRLKVMAYSLLTKEIKEKEVPLVNREIGERAEIIFEDIPWKVILSDSSFSFFSEGTGEVFSDENGSVAGALRQKLQLDTVLDNEELSNLNFPVEEAKSTEEAY